MTAIILIIFLSQALATSAQILFKKTANTLRKPHLKNMRSYGDYIWQIITKKRIWAGFFLMVGAVGCWIAALSQADLSLAYPLGSVYYILVLFSARIFLGEKINRMKIYGTGLIMAGIVLISLSRQF